MKQAVKTPSRTRARSRRSSGRAVLCAAEATTNIRHSPLRALQMSLECVGERVVWDWLLVTSGAAFRVAFADTWSDAALYAVPTDLLMYGARAYGYTGRWDFGDGGLTRVRALLKEGVPVMTAGLVPGYGPPVWVRVVECDPKTRTVIVSGLGDRPMRVTAAEGSPAGGHQWEGIVPGRLFATPPLLTAPAPLFSIRPMPEKLYRETIVRDTVALAIDVAKGRTVPLNGRRSPRCTVGLDAYARWAGALQMLDTHTMAEHDAAITRIMFHLPLIIVEGRRAAWAFLRHAAQWIEGDPVSFLLAAGSYRATADLAQQLWDLVFAVPGEHHPPPSRLSIEIPGMSAVPRLMVSECRQQAVALIGRIGEEERVAVDALKRVMDTIDQRGSRRRRKPSAAATAE